MNINRYSINSLLKFTLIFGFILGTVNSVLAQENNKVQKQELLLQGKQEESNKANEQSEDKLINQESNSKDENQQTLELKEKQEQSQEYIELEKKDKLTKSKDSRKSQENLTIKYILIFIDLPITLILLLLWFLNQKKQQEQIDGLTKNQNKINSNFTQFNETINKLNKLDQIKLQIIEKIQDSDQKNLDSEMRLRELLSKQQFNQSVNYRNNLTPDISHSNSNVIVDKISEFVKTYNQDKNLSSERIIATVKSTQENVEQRRIGNIDTVTLKTTTNKKYWIIELDNNYYLIPHAKIRIDEHNKTTLESLFDCTNFTSEYLDFQLVKLAKVSQIDSETWQLEEKGKLNFY